MTGELAMVVVLLAAAIVMFAMNRPRMDVVALMMLIALPLTGVITVGEALAGFSDGNVVLIAGLFVIGDGLVRTGVARRLGDWLSSSAGSNEIGLIALLMVVVCGLGSMMSSTAVTAIFIPVALRISQSTGVSPRRLLMPISMAALISGMTTLIATAPNLVVSSELERRGHAGFHFFAFTPFGIPILFLGLIYMAVARRWLGSSAEQNQTAATGPTFAEWIEDYGLARREMRVIVPADSELTGHPLSELRLRNQYGARLIAIQRRSKLIEPTAQTMLEAGDVLLVDFSGSTAEADRLIREFSLQQLPLTGGYFTDYAQDIGMAEVIVPATSDLVGVTLAETNFYDRYRLRVIGLRRGHSAIESELEQQPLKIGDTLLVIGPWRAIRKLNANRQELVVLNLPAELEEVLPVPGKAWHAVACLVLVVGLMISGVVPNVLAALMGCLLMGALGVTDMNSAYRSIDWKTLVLIVGMLPFSLALDRTGGVDLMADGLTRVVGDFGAYGILATIFALTAVLGMFISNTATAVLMAPVALAMAEDLGVSPYPFAMIVALAASTAFMTPVSSPVNTLVVTPGEYTFGDFVKIGVPFSILVLIVSVVLVPWLLPL
ncbi:MAG: SLC13 family permease [Pirellulales bacterium]